MAGPIEQERETTDDPVTWPERWRAAGVTVVVIAVFAAVIGVVQAVRGGSYPRAGAVAITVVVVTGIAFAFPRYRRYGGGRRIDWSKESTGSKVAIVVAVVLFTAILVARTIWRLDD